MLRGQVEGIGTRAALRREGRGRRRSWPRSAGRAGDDARPRRRARAHRRLAASAARRRPSPGRGRPPRRARRRATTSRRCASTPRVLAELETLIPLAPLHQPHNLAPIRALLAARAASCRRWPASTPRSTARSPRVAQMFALPAELDRRGRAPLRLPRAVVRVHRRRCCRSSTRARGARPDGGRSTSATAPACARSTAGAQRRQHDGLHRASTGCRWARAAARSIPA